MNKYVNRVFFCAVVLSATVWGQTAAPPPDRAATAAQSTTRPTGSGVVRGTVKDDTGGVIPGATVTLTDANGAVQKTTTRADGTYVLRGVAAGTYTLAAIYTNLQPVNPVVVQVTPGQPTVGNIVMTVQEQKQEVTVTDTSTNQVSTDPTNNASQLVLKQEDLDALPDDPDDLEADLQALAGPSAGPGGNQIFIDGFTGGRLPPKESIREIRINSNPFSAEFDKLGYGRIQIFTKPGSDKFHGQSYYSISDDIWNSRNPFLSVNPPFRTQLFGGNVSGPLGKHASFFVDVERRNIDDNGIVTASIPTADFLGAQSLQTYFPTPQRRTTVSPRVDWQLGANNTLSFRYSWLENDRQVAHIGSFDLPQTTVGGITFPSNGYAQSINEQSVQVVETAVLSPHVVNETHFEYERDNQGTRSFSTLPQLNVGQAFVAGGSGYSSPTVPNAYDLQNYYELQNYTTATWGTHTTKFGFRIRATALDDLTAQSFNGTYYFLGGNGLTSIQQYLTTEQLLTSGLSSAQVTAMGYGPSKFSINQGNPYIGLSQLDFGPFVQDDWRARPNLTVSVGLRWEGQTNISDKNDWAPRVGFAWSPGARGTGRPKTVIRGGWGVFYSRLQISDVETAYRYNGANQIVYTVDRPTVYNNTFSIVPPQSELSIVNSAQRYQIDNNFRASRLMQTAIGVDRQLFGRTTLSLNFLNSRGVHEPLTNDINAPLAVPGELPPGTPESILGTVGGNLNSLGIRPYGDVGDIYDYQSVGTFKQMQAIASVNSSVGRWFTLFGRYSYSQAHSNTDGLSTLPSNPYNIAEDWGRSSLDFHHTLFMGGSIAAKWGLRFSPFIVARSGQPFNISTGTDLYLIGQGTPTARPEVSSTDFFGSSYNSRLGLWVNPYPVVGAPLIQRNYATGPGFLGMNLRVSKTWGFGTTKFQGQVGGTRARGGGFGGGGGHGGGPGGMFGGESTEHRYNLTLSVGARNILNHENLNTPNGSLTSPYFFESTGIAGGFGPESTASNQRRIDLQLRFAF